MKHLPQEHYRLTGLGDQQINGLKDRLKAAERSRELSIRNRLAIGSLSNHIINLKRQIKEIE